MGKILGGLKLAAWLAPILLTLTAAVMIPLIRWAVKGAISEELDKRIPLTQKLTQEELKRPDLAQAKPVHLLIPAAEASPTSTSDKVVARKGN